MGTIRLSREDQERFANALLDPPPVAPALKRAKELHDKLVEPSQFQVTKAYSRLSRESSELAQAMRRIALGLFRWVSLRCPSCGDDFDLLLNPHSGSAVVCPKCKHEEPVSRRGPAEQ